MCFQNISFFNSIKGDIIGSFSEAFAHYVNIDLSL